MSDQPRYDFDSDTVRFEEEMHGHPVSIEVGRGDIEDKLSAESLTPDECIDFVNRNRRQLVENVRHFIRHAPDVTGIRLHTEMFAHCR